ncbi:MAG: TonB-dependent receptor, partial [Chitinophagaceae bacterium]
NNNGINRNFNLQADYTVPVGKAGKIEAGLRNQIRKSESSTLATRFNDNTGQFDYNYALTNDFNSTDRVSAAYVNYQNTINSFGYQIGLRAEDASLDTRLGTYGPAINYVTTPGKVAYTRLYPSVFLSQKLEGDNQLQLSYSRRVNRPRGWDTNPFRDVSDPTNIRMGNPNLLPEDVHAFELSHSKYFRKGSFTTSAYMRRTNDEIQRITFEPEAESIATTTIPLNVATSTSFGLELINRTDVSKKWNFTTNVNLYQRNISAVPEYDLPANKGFSWNANLTNNITLPYNITLQIKGDYRSREVTAQGYRRSMYAFDGGAKYDFPNKSASLSLNVRDIFNTRNWTTVTRGINDASLRDSRRYQQGTIMNLTFSYRFGKSTFEMKKKKPEQQENRSDEENF